MFPQQVRMDAGLNFETHDTVYRTVFSYSPMLAVTCETGQLMNKRARSRFNLQGI